MRDITVLSLINKWRSELMGIAILWIVLFHSQLILPYGLETVKTIGYGGVDIFLLLSGCGIYYSLHKSRDMISFYVRRIKRIFPAYLPFITLWCIYKLGQDTLEPIETMRVVIGNMCLTGWINDVPYQFNWYVQMICGLYFLAPIFYAIIFACKKKWQYLLLFLGTVVAGIPFFCDLTHLMGVSRVPIFLLGMLWGHLTYQKEEILQGKIKQIVLVGAMIIGFFLVVTCIYYYPETLWAYGTWWYPFLLITPGLCYVLSGICEVGERIKIGKLILWPLKWIGKSSFEIYLIHIAAYDMAQMYRGTLNNRQWVKLMLAAVVAGIFYHLIIEGIKRVLIRKKSNVRVTEAE